MREGQTEAVRPRLRLAVGTLTSDGDVVGDASSESSSKLIAAPLMANIRRLALTDKAYYQPLIARAEHLGLTVKDGLVYSPGPAGLLYIPQNETLRTTLMREVHDAPT